MRAPLNTGISTETVGSMCLVRNINGAFEAGPSASAIHPTKARRRLVAPTASGHVPAGSATERAGSMGFGWLNGTTDFASWYWRYGAATTPAAALVALAAVVWVLHRLRAARVGDYRDPEVQKRGASRLVGFGLRHLFAWATKPMVSLLVMAGVGPTAVTGLSAILSIASGVALGAGWFGLGGWLYLLSGVCDFLDGRIARVSGRATARGAALDSILDRYGEAAVLTGLAYYFRGSWVLLIAVVTLAGSLLVSYVRARGEGLGVQFPNVGLMQRPRARSARRSVRGPQPGDRCVFRRPGFAMPVVAMLLVLAVTTHWTTIVRLRYVWKALGDAEKEPGSPPGWRASIWGTTGSLGVRCGVRGGSGAKRSCSGGAVRVGGVRRSSSVLVRVAVPLG